MIPIRQGLFPDETLRHKIWRALNTDEVAEPNAFAVDAAVAAFTKGAPWLDALRAYIAGNKQLVSEFINQNLPEIKAVCSEATYLVWLDCKSLPEDGERICRVLSGICLTVSMALSARARCPEENLYSCFRE